MYLAVDIGGTKTLIALFSKHGRVVNKVKFKTAESYDDFTKDLALNLKAFKSPKIKIVVVAIPGLVQKNCSVSFGNRNWKNVNLLETVKSLFSCPVFFENDASLATLYEAFRLKGRTVFLTFSTGIGGGVVENKRILPESSTFEPGHRFYRYKGELKEWEDIAASSALEKVYQIDRATDLRGEDKMRDVANRVSLGLKDIIDEFRPRTIVLGGPLGKIFRLYVKYLPKSFEVKFKQPKRPTESVIYGAYLYAKQKEKE